MACNNCGAEISLARLALTLGQTKRVLDLCREARGEGWDKPKGGTP